MSEIPENAQRVVVEFSRELIDSEEAQEEYGSWYQTWECSVDAVRLTDEATRHGDDAFLIGPGDHAHVLVVTYDDGDSFGNKTGLMDVIHAFANREAAQAAMDLYAANDAFESIVFKDDFGREIKMPMASAHNSYFESRTSIEVLTMEIVL